MKLNDFHYGMVLAHQLFGIEINDTDYEEIALVAWNLIGNKRCRLYRARVKVDCKTGEVAVPCNADIIEAVVRCGEDFQTTTNYSSFENFNSAFTEGYIESRKTNKSPFYINGGYVKYHQVDDKIWVDPSLGSVEILYKGVELDDDGLPQITDKEAMAIAFYLAYILLYKKSMLTQNLNIMRFSQVLKADWERKCDGARVDKEYWSQNDMNNILDVKTNWNRKIFGKSYKPIK